MRYISIRDWDELEDRMFRGEWLAGVLILAFILAVAAALIWGV